MTNTPGADAPDKDGEDGKAVPHACATCHAPLNRVVTMGSDGVGERWYHPPGADLDGHEPVPVPRGETDVTTMVCDVCSTPRPQWLYPTEESVHNVDTGMVDRSMHITDLEGGWAICATCARLVEGRDVKSMIKRAMALNPSMRDSTRSIPPAMRSQMKQQITVMLTDAYRQFFSQITGPRKPLV